MQMRLNISLVFFRICSEIQGKKENMAISIKEIVRAIHCLVLIEDHLEELRKGQEDFREWIREAIDEIDDRITRLELIESGLNKLPEPKP